MFYLNEIIYFFIAILFVILLFIFFKPKYKKFKNIILHNVLWKWKWKGKNIYGLNAYCLTCKKQIVFDDENARNIYGNLSSKVTFFICENCNGEEKGRIQGGDRKYAFNMVKREIYRLIQTKQYKEILNEV